MLLKSLAAWALIFIFRLRFPPGVSIATILKVVNTIYILWKPENVSSKLLLTQLSANERSEFTTAIFRGIGNSGAKLHTLEDKLGTLRH